MNVLVKGHLDQPTAWPGQTKLSFEMQGIDTVVDRRTF